MSPTALLSAQPAAALPVTGADLILYLVVAGIVGITGLLVRRASTRAELSATGLTTSKKLQ
jgi:hypothetical protein